MFIDESAISNRMMQWMDFKYQVSAELYYDTTGAMSNAKQNAWQTQYEFRQQRRRLHLVPGQAVGHRRHARYPGREPSNEDAALTLIGRRRTRSTQETRRPETRKPEVRSGRRR
jgi:hypothetical protein